MKANELSKHFLWWFQNEYPDARIYRNNAGCFKTQAGNWVRYGIPNKGGSDFIAFVSNSSCNYCQSEICEYKCKITWINAQFYEIKTKNDRMSKDQIKFANQITKMGGDYFIVHENPKTINVDVQKGGNISSKKNNNVMSLFTSLSLGFYIEKWELSND